MKKMVHRQQHHLHVTVYITGVRLKIQKDTKIKRNKTLRSPPFSTHREGFASGTPSILCMSLSLGWPGTARYTCLTQQNVIIARPEADGPRPQTLGDKCIYALPAVTPPSKLFTRPTDSRAEPGATKPTKRKKIRTVAPTVMVLRLVG